MAGRRGDRHACALAAAVFSVACTLLLPPSAARALQVPLAPGFAPSLVDTSTHTAEGMLVTLPGGRILDCYREGSAAQGHVGDSGRVMCRTSDDGGATWNVPALVYNDRYDDRNVAGGLIGSRVAVLFRERETKTQVGIAVASVYSDDGGATWSTPATVPGVVTGCAFSGVVRVPALGYVVPFYSLAGRVGYLTSSDGTTWSAPVYIPSNPAEGLSEPTMAYGDGLWVVACRRGSGAGYTMFSSADEGLTWTPATCTGRVAPRLAAVGGTLMFDDGRFVLIGATRQSPGRLWVYSSSAWRLGSDVEDWTLLTSLVHPSLASGIFYGYPIATKREDGSVLGIVTDYASAAAGKPEDADLYSFSVPTSDTAPPVLSFEVAYVAGHGGAIQGPRRQAMWAGGTGAPVTAVPSPGYRFVRWSDGLTTPDRTDGSVIADATRTATFVLVPIPTAVTVKASVARVARGHSVVLRGTISSTQPKGTHVIVYARRPGSHAWVKLSTRSTSSAHRWSYTYSPSVRGTWYFRVRFAGTARYRSATSSSVRVVVV